MKRKKFLNTILISISLFILGLINSSVLAGAFTWSVINNSNYPVLLSLGTNCMSDAHYPYNVYPGHPWAGDTMGTINSGSCFFENSDLHIYIWVFQNNAWKLISHYYALCGETQRCTDSDRTKDIFIDKSWLRRDQSFDGLRTIQAFTISNPSSK